MRAPAPHTPSTKPRWWFGLLLLGAGVLIVWSLVTLEADAGATSGTEAPEGTTASGGRGPSPSGRESGVTPGQRDPARALHDREREARVQEARQRLSRYREATRLPPHSRPAREQTDRMFPQSPVRERPLSLDETDAEGAELKLRLGQSRISLAGDESVEVWIQCLDEDSRVVACEVTGRAHEAEHAQPEGGAASPVPLVFVEEHRDLDGAAPGPVWLARLTPAREGFALYRGTLRLGVRIQAGQTVGQAFFDVVYTGAPPATLTAAITETMEEGDLLLRVPIAVKEAGRYVFEARLDDARGDPFALLGFNEVLPAGDQRLSFRLAGLLVHDEAPAFPLMLRDVEGFLLHESGEPDRAHVLPLTGPVHRTRAWQHSDFGREEWQGEQRQRYLKEFSLDVERAQAELDESLP